MNSFFLQIGLCLIVLTYVVLTIITVSGLRRKHSINTDHEPPVSVIIVAKDEENFLPNCLNSMKNLDYPQHKLEFILVNDRSSDQTGRIMADFVDSTPNSKMITVRENPKSVTGKSNGLHQGVMASQGEILLFTDGDCIVPSKWIRTTVRAYDTQTGLVGGFLILDKKGEKNSLFSRVQSLDWIYITSVGSAWANLSRPFSVFGNNLSVRKTVYNKVGGFQAVGNDITEDFALSKNIYKNTLFRVYILLDPENTVYTQPAKNLREFFHQRKRWAIGGRSHGILAYLLMSTVFLSHLLIPVTLFIGLYTIGIFGFLLLMVSDCTLLFRPLKALKRLDLMRYLFLYEIYYFGYTLFFAPFLLFARSVRWKTNLYRRNPKKIK